MPELSQEEVLKIATLARLRLSAEEIADYQKKLGRVLEHIKELSALKTPQDAFVRHVPEDSARFGQDSPEVYEDTVALLGNAPASEGRSFLLPKVVEHSE